MPPAGRLELTRPATFWAGSAALLAGIGWFKGINLMLLLGDFLIALLVLNAWTARRAVRGVAAVRRETGPVFAGETVLVSVTVRSDAPARGSAMIVDGSGEPPLRWLLSPGPPATPTLLRGERTSPARGRFAVGPLLAESGHPLGLARSVRAAGPAGERIVLPAVGGVSVDGLRRFALRASSGDGRSRRPARRHAPGQGDLRGVRPYRPGDSPRDIHWRSTARRNQLVVREYDQTDPLHLVLVVDPWLPDAPTPDQAAALEWALSLAASVAWAWARADEPGDLALVVPGAESPSAARATEGSVRRMLAPLAELRGSAAVPAPEPERLRPNAPRTARLVVSSRPDGPVLAAIRARGLPAAGVDPAVPLRWYRAPSAGG